MENAVALPTASWSYYGVSNTAPTWKILAAIGIAIFLWSGNNIASKIVISEWPVMASTCVRFGIGSFILLGVLGRFSSQRHPQPIDAKLRRELWLGPGLSFTVYLMSFIWALNYTTASHVALYFAASPAFAMLWDRLSGQAIPWTRTLLAASLTFTGVLWLFLPSLSGTESTVLGDSLAFLGSLLWVHYSHQSRQFQGRLPAAQLNGEIFWRTTLLTSPFFLYDIATQTIEWSTPVVIAFVYTAIGPSILAFLAWSYALRHWPTSKVMLFVNLIPLMTALWAYAILGETVGRDFWIAVSFVAAGVYVSVGRMPLLGKRSKA